MNVWCHNATLTPNDPYFLQSQIKQTEKDMHLPVGKKTILKAMDICHIITYNFIKRIEPTRKKPKYFLVKTNLESNALHVKNLGIIHNNFFPWILPLLDVRHCCKLSWY